MNHGIAQKHWDRMIQVLKGHPQIKSVFLYGSRARGDFKNGSDIDLALQFQQSDKALLAKIKWELDDLNLVYKMDVLDLDQISDEVLKAKIEADKKKII